MSMNTPPTLYCPFDSSVSPYAERVDRDTLLWAHAAGLLANDTIAERVQAARIGWLAAYLAPAASREALQLLSDWTTWAIMWDDICDHPSRRAYPAQLATDHARFLALLHGDRPSDADSPFDKALWNIRQRLLQLSSTPELDLFIGHVAEFFAGCAWESSNRAQHRPLDIATYIKMRRFTSGMYTALKVVEIADRIALPLAVWDHPAVAELRERATNTVCWANDIISLNQELQRGEIHNLVIVYQITHGADLASSVDRVIALHDEEVDGMLAVERRLPQFGEPIDRYVRQYVALLRSFIYGNLAWSAISGRYGVAREEMHVLGQPYQPMPVPPHTLLMRATKR